MKTFWSLLLALVLPAAAANGTTDLQVIVLTKGTGDPVVGATVVMADGTFADTDAKGRVTLSPVKLPTQLRILAPGYDPLPVDVATSPVTAYIIPDAQQSTGLVVVDDRIPEKVSKIALTANEIENAPGTGGDPIKTIQTLPGVVTATDGTGVMYMRGSDVQDNNVEVDGLPIAYLYHLGGLQSTINPELVKDFNVFLGGFPVEYGDHLGGAIDVQLRAPKNDRLHQTYQIGTYDSSFLIEGPVKNAPHDSFFIAARRSYLDFLLTPEQLTKSQKDNGDPDSRNTFVTVPRFYDAQALWRHTLDRGTIDFQYFAAGDELALINNKSAASDPDLAGEFNAKASFQTAGMNWRQQWSRQWSHQMTLSVNRLSQRTRMGTDASGQPFYVDADPQTVRIQPEFYFQPSNSVRYTFGSELQYVEYPLSLYVAEMPALGQVDYNFSTAPKHRIDRTLYAGMTAPFAEYRRQWGNLTTEFGLRYSTFHGSGGIGDHTLSPRMSLEYALSPTTLLTAAWGRYVQIPNAAYLLEGYGNPGLVYTEAEHRIVGVKFKLKPLWSMQLEAYQKPMTNLVVGTGLAAPDNYVNKGTGEAYGADLLIKRESANGKMGWLSYSYAKSSRTNQYTGTDYSFVGDQPHTLNVVWSQPFGGDWHRWNWGVRVHVASGKPYTPVIGSQQTTLPDGRTQILPEYGEPYSKRLPMYFRMDVRIDHRVLFDRSMLTFYFDLQNVTNYQNVTGYDYGSRYQYIDSPRKITGVPFMPFFGVRTTF